MKPLFDSPAKRSTASVVLLMWLFAMASGVANACLLEAREAHHHDSPAAHSNEAATEMSTGQLADFVAVDVDVDSSKVPCLKFCDDQSQSLLKQHSSIDLTGAGVAILVAVVWNVTDPMVTVPGRLARLQPRALGPPIRVRFSRLAL